MADRPCPCGFEVCEPCARREALAEAAEALAVWESRQWPETGDPCFPSQVVRALLTPPTEETDGD